MRLPLNGSPRITNTHGNPGWGRFNKHLGYDYGVGIGTHVYAPESGKIVSASSGGSGGRILELVSSDGKRHHRFLHLSNNAIVRVGQTVSRGQWIARSGNTGYTTGAHLHHDVRKAGTTWSASFANYYDWHKLVEAYNTPKFNMPPVNSRIQLLPRDTRTTFKAGTTTPAGRINITNNSFIYIVRGYDSRYPNRILINSASAGGNGVALALYYTNGTVIKGWKRI
jgi:murein DD-endopeptidase MepM/ murein hydrolase activator NlpD